MWMMISLFFADFKIYPFSFQRETVLKNKDMNIYSLSDKGLTRRKSINQMKLRVQSL